MIDELITYRVAEGQLLRMRARFREVNKTLFDKYGFSLIGAWVDSYSSEFLYMVSFPDAPTRDLLWSQYHADELYESSKGDASTLIQSIHRRVMEPLDNASPEHRLTQKKTATRN